MSGTARGAAKRPISRPDSGGVGRTAGALNGIARLVAGRPFTSSVVVAILTLALVTGPLNGPGIHVRSWAGTGFEPVVEGGRWWTPLTSVFFTDSLFELLTVLILAVLLLGWAERLMGTRRTALAFAATTIVGTLAGIGLQALGARGGELWAHGVIELVTFDPLTAIGGAIAAGSAFASALWRRRIRVLIVLVSVMFLLYSGQPDDLYRLLAILAGLGLGVLLHDGRVSRTWVRSSHHEVRVLLASVVLITALGPVIALLSSSRFGPLAPIGMLFSNEVPAPGDVVDRCQAFAVTRACVRDVTLERINGLGPILVSVLPLLVLLVAAYGLLRGRRFGVWLAVAVNLLLSGLSAVYFGLLPLPAAASGPRTSGRYAELTVDFAVSALLPLVIAVVLIAMRSHFPVLASSVRLRRYLLIVVIAGLSLAALYVSVGWVLRETGFTRPVGVEDLLNDVVERFIPVSFLRREPVGYLPTSALGTMVYHNVGTVFWLIVVLAAIPVMRDDSTRNRGGDAARARRLLGGGGDAISFMSTWPGNSYWFDPVDEVAVAYRVIGRIALTTGGPFGAAPGHDTLGRFARFCDDNGWVPVFYSIDDGTRARFQSMGWETMVVAEETVLRPQQWEMTGKKWQDVRSSINRAQRAGIRAEWTTYSELPLATANQLSEISEQWIAEKDLPEMGFTLGGLDELRDPAVRLMLAIGDDGQVEGVTSWLPRYRNGEVVGWTLDFMRRRPGSINGVMEFLIAEAAIRMRADGVETMSLSAAPLAHTARGGDADRSVMDRVLGFMSASLEPVYGFRSLLAFKRKFQPEYHPLIMAFPDPVALPAIGVALVRAYLPGISMRQAAGLARGRG
ncbi:bifunctional lysylphosphatidylglycerol flippase/synthetase MprF [Diaminobutyricibacter sp. McL0608]|uniref:bifunctional lysylphosphatidylglycerol flippase/synthetase MprF n=1 Tax=Leifsonia sp. McL0608 TaxID=3143537 RepID=UPI0031F2D5E2